MNTKDQLVAAILICAKFSDEFVKSILRDPRDLDKREIMRQSAIISTAKRDVLASNSDFYPFSKLEVVQVLDELRDVVESEIYRKFPELKMPRRTRNKER